MLNITLGQGTYSKVITDKNNSNTVIKITDSTDYDNIIREVAFLAYIDHPNIVNIKSINIHSNGICELKMDKYDCNLSDFIKYIHRTEKNLINNINITKITLEITSGLAYLHNIDIIHGDIKTKNILVKNNLSIAICDFNISLLCEYDNSYLSSLIQTCNYRSPEIDVRHSRSRYDQRIDIWGLGCVMYELLTGNKLLEYTGAVSDEDSTTTIVESFMLPTINNRSERYKKLCKLTPIQIKDILYKKIERLKLSIQWNSEQLLDYITLMALCLTPNKKLRARTNYILYLLLNLYKKLTNDNISFINDIMYHLEKTERHQRKIQPIERLNITKYLYKYFPNKNSHNHIINTFNLSSLNYANRLYKKIKKNDKRCIYTILYLAMAVCGEPHEEVMCILENEYTKRQLYNTSIDILEQLDYNIIC